MEKDYIELIFDLLTVVRNELNEIKKEIKGLKNE